MVNKEIRSIKRRIGAKGGWRNTSDEKTQNNVDSSETNRHGKRDKKTRKARREDNNAKNRCHNAKKKKKNTRTHENKHISPHPRSFSPSPGRRLNLGGLLQGGGHSVLGQVQVLAEVLDSLVVEDKVVHLPRERVGDEAAGLERLQELDDVQVGHLEVGVLGQRLLLGGDDTL